MESPTVTLFRTRVSNRSVGAGEFEASGCNLDDLGSVIQAGGLDIQHHDPTVLVLIDEAGQMARRRRASQS